MPTSSAASLGDAPAADVLEVSIFGPGKGESVVVHLGSNTWMVVDSCLERRTAGRPKVPSPLAYLMRMGVDVGSCVKLVVATHAHDDHFAGIAELYRNCHSADFVCSTAMSKEEFWSLAEADARLADDLRPRAYSEYSAIRDELRRRSGVGPNFRPMLFAIERRPILSLSGPPRVLVTALSPSDEAVRRSLVALARAFSSAQDVGGRAISADPNELSVALWVQVADKAVLLGADLPRGPAGCGWIAVLAAFSAFNPGIKASAFKVPHHGSVTAHHEDVWDEMLEPGSVALMSPFRGGRKPLPGPEDRQRILALTPEAFITASPYVASVAREAAELGPIAENPRELWRQVGHVRARSRIGESGWHVNLAAPASRLDSLAGF